MGKVVLEGRAGLKFNGSSVNFADALAGIEKLVKAPNVGKFVVEVVPSVEGGIIIDLAFKGTGAQFESLILALDDLRGGLAIETVPLPEHKLPDLNPVSTKLLSKAEKGKPVWRWNITATAKQ
jgi:hypothetical protein